MNPQQKSPIFQILIESPDLKIPIQSITIPNPNPNQIDLKSSIFPKLFPQLSPQTLASIYFTINGKPLSDSQNYHFTPLSTLTLRLRLRGGGGDGGATGAESRDCYLNMYAVKKPDKCDPHEQRLSKWLNCSLSCEPLRAPVVIDKLGNLFNKEAIVEALLKKRVPKGFGYIRGLRDLVSVELFRGEGGFGCPVTGLEFNGRNRFVAIRTCGHVLSAKAFRELRGWECLVCRKEYGEEDKIVINGNEEEVTVLRARLEAERGKVKDGRKAKKGSGGEDGVMEKGGDVNGTIEVKSVGDGLGNGVAKYGSGGEKGVEVERLSGKKHGIEVKSVGEGSGSGGAKKFKAVAPAYANKEVYASIFTSSSKKKDFKETYSCRSLPLGRN